MNKKKNIYIYIYILYKIRQLGLLHGDCSGTGFDRVILVCGLAVSLWTHI